MVACSRLGLESFVACEKKVIQKIKVHIRAPVKRAKTKHNPCHGNKDTNSQHLLAVFKQFKFYPAKRNDQKDSDLLRLCLLFVASTMLTFVLHPKFFRHFQLDECVDMKLLCEQRRSSGFPAVLFELNNASINGLKDNPVVTLCLAKQEHFFFFCKNV